MRAKQTFFCFLFIAATLYCSAQSRLRNTFYDSVFSASRHIYDFHFSSASAEMSSFASQHPEDFLSHLLAANFFWWTLISGDDSDQNQQKYYSALEQSLRLLQPQNKNIANDTLYALIATYAYKARIHALNNQYFSALAQLNTCIDFVKQSFGKENEYEWFQLTSGIYNYYLIAVKKNYPFLIPYLFFLPEGNAQNGIKFLRQASVSENFLLQTEAEYFLMKIYLEEEKNYAEARKYSSLLLLKFPENLLYRYYQFKSLLEENNVEQATKELGLLKYYSEKNSELSQKQKEHFIRIAKNDLNNYYTVKK